MGLLVRVLAMVSLSGPTIVVAVDIDIDHVLGLISSGRSSSHIAGRIVRIGFLLCHQIQVLLSSHEATLGYVNPPTDSLGLAKNGSGGG